MTVTALVSGGKDSIYSAYLADTQGMTVDELVVLRPADPDSMMFHTPNLSMVALQARAWGKAARTIDVPGSSETDELHAARQALAGVRGPVVTGAIASTYQWSRLQAITFDLGRPLYAPLWGKEPGRVVREEIGAGLDIRLVHLAAEPLTPDLLGRRLDLALVEEIERRSREVRAVHIAGEGGEYETLVTDLPAWTHRLVLDRVEPVVEGSTSRWVVRGAHLEPKGHPGYPPQP
ncbi:MAG TPA: diphthine--ammonia ligase [Thermoplasmata archaeon]|nr:diphthine--ammonia ligase [Thermoplasmata archaeon]